MNHSNLAKKLMCSKQQADQVISKLTPNEKTKMEKTWDVEHAYYFSALENSHLDRKDFEELAKRVN